MFNCQNCGKELLERKNTANKYCNNKCQQNHAFRTRKEKFYNGENTSSPVIKRILIEDRGYKCESCDNSEWMGEPITLELEHSDGNYMNNNIDNLKLLCPNCHSMTPTFKGKNRGNGRKYRYDKHK